MTLIPFFQRLVIKLALQRDDCVTSSRRRAAWPLSTRSAIMRCPRAGHTRPQAGVRAPATDMEVGCAYRSRVRGGPPRGLRCCRRVALRLRPGSAPRTDVSIWLTHQMPIRTWRSVCLSKRHFLIRACVPVLPALPEAGWTVVVTFPAAFVENRGPSLFGGRFTRTRPPFLRSHRHPHHRPRSVSSRCSRRTLQKPACSFKELSSTILHLGGSSFEAERPARGPGAPRITQSATRTVTIVWLRQTDRVRSRPRASYCLSVLMTGSPELLQLAARAYDHEFDDCRHRVHGLVRRHSLLSQKRPALRLAFASAM